MNIIYLTNKCYSTNCFAAWYYGCEDNEFIIWTWIDYGT